jgi:hypothetical protein
MRGGWAMVAIDLAVLASVLSFVTVLGIWGYSNYQKQELARAKSHAQKLAISLQAAVARQDYQMIYSSLMGAKNSSNVQLDERQQALFDEAAFKLGQRELAAGRDSAAADFFQQVSIVSDNYVSARQFLFNFSAPSYQPRVSPVQPVDTNGSNNRGQRISSRQQSLGTLPERAQISDKPVLSIPVIPEIEKNKAESQNAASQGPDGTVAATTSASEPPTPKFSESEISRYNRQLAAYFAKQNAGSDAGAEPPSFKEWLRQGKPTF